MLPSEDRLERGTVITRLRDSEGLPVGKKDYNPTLDTSQYSVEFPGGIVKEYTANVIVENMVAQCDSEGRQYSFFNGIIDHQKTPEAVEKEDGKFITQRGQ